MNSDRESSTAATLFRSLLQFWLPAVKALELKQNLLACSLEQSQGEAERAGCEVSYADLPTKVSGFAQVIAGKPHIVLNREKPLKDLKYTLPHELGHSVLHLSPTRGVNELGFPLKGMEELEAHLFAATWVLGTANHKEREEVLRHNPEASFILFSWVMLSLVGIATALTVHVCQRIFGAPPSPPITRK